MDSGYPLTLTLSPDGGREQFIFLDDSWKERIKKSLLPSVGKEMG